MAEKLRDPAAGKKLLVSDSQTHASTGATVTVSKASLGNQRVSRKTLLSACVAIPTVAERPAVKKAFPSFQLHATFLATFRIKF